MPFLGATFLGRAPLLQPAFLRRTPCFGATFVFGAPFGRTPLALFLAARLGLAFSRAPFLGPPLALFLAARLGLAFSHAPFLGPPLFLDYPPRFGLTCRGAFLVGPALGLERALRLGPARFERGHVGRAREQPRLRRPRTRLDARQYGRRARFCIGNTFRDTRDDLGRRRLNRSHVRRRG